MRSIQSLKARKNMKFLVRDLKYRAHLKKPHQEPNDDGGFDISYITIVSFWMGLENESSYIRAIRGENSGEGITQIGIARFSTFEYLGSAFTRAFSLGFDVIADINPVKSNYFIFIESKSSVNGRLFKIHGMARDERNHNWMKIQLEEIEEQGTGYQE